MRGIDPDIFGQNTSKINVPDCQTIRLVCSVWVKGLNGPISAEI